MGFKDNLMYKEGRKYRTICEVIREIETKHPEERELCEEATYYAKRMNAKLIQYKQDYVKEVFDKPTKENTKVKRNLFGLIINMIDLGSNKVIGRMQGTLSLTLLVFTYLSVQGLFFDWVTMLIFFIGVICIIFFSGAIYYKTKLFAKEVD